MYNDNINTNESIQYDTMESLNYSIIVLSYIDTISDLS